MIVALLVLILLALVFPGVVRFLFGLVALLMVAACLQTAQADESHWLTEPTVPPQLLPANETAATRNSVPLPYHNVEKACGTYKTAGVYNDCISGEQSAYNELTSSWDNLPDDVVLPCSRVPNVGVPNFYRATLNCVFAWSERYRQDHPGPRQHFRY